MKNKNRTVVSQMLIGFTLLLSVFFFLFSQNTWASQKSMIIDHNNQTNEQGKLNKIYYEGNWQKNSSNHWGNNGASFEITFNGNQISLYGNKNETNGQANVFIDGKKMKEISYHGKKTANTLIYTSNKLEEVKHTIRVESLGWINHVRAIIHTEMKEDLRSWYKQYEALQKENYTKNSWQQFQPVLLEAKILVENTQTTNEELLAIKKKVKNAADKLVMNSGLKQMVAEYMKRRQSDYTSHSWTNFQTALQLANVTIQADDASRQAIVENKNNLQKAADQLIPLSDDKFEAIQNNTFWHDTAGNPIFSQGGGIFKFGDKYYWYGVRYEEAEAYYQNPTKMYSPNSPHFYSITCYSSVDLVHWTFERNVATKNTKLFIDAGKDVSEDYFSKMDTLADASWIGRLGVVYNEKTGKYTLLVQMETKFDPVRGTNACVLFLQGDSPTDNFNYATIQTTIKNAPVQGTGDQTVFTDDDGQNYLIFSGRNGRKHTFVSKISAEDSLSIEPGVQIGYVSSGREGNALFHLNHHYYAASSDLHGWNASQTHIIRSQTNNILGNYSTSYILPGTEKDYSHVTQTGFFVKVKGKKQETVIYCGDRWADFAWNGLGYNQWMPISANEKDIQLHSLSNWKLNTVTGEWQVGDNNNYILNPEFAADRIIVNKLTGWENQLEENSANFVSNVSPGSNRTRFGLQLGADQAYGGSVYQEIQLPKGKYHFCLDKNSLGDLDIAKVIIQDGKRKTYEFSLKEKTNGWQTKEWKDIEITSGKAKIGLYVKSKTGGHYLKIDNLSLTKQTDE
ncbi:hypothetical protein [Melissococcus plutonius]|uniref:hypothetical protein n=1 Tax=Melissococcus plutonius TaxID=33970 RepID=UPI003EE43FFB